jgi:RHS repeat-associated protein
MTSATVGGTTTTYAYDGDNVRTSKTQGSTTTNFLWDRLAGLPDLIGQNDQSYLHADGVTEGIDGSGTATYPLTDGVGSVRGRTDSSGALIGTADYDVFGMPRGSTGTGGTFGYSGEQTDPETGQLHLRARQYAPGLGRFTSADRVIPNAGGTQGYNAYAYVANNPGTWTDPSGHEAGQSTAEFGIDCQEAYDVLHNLILVECRNWSPPVGS